VTTWVTATVLMTLARQGLMNPGQEFTGSWLRSATRGQLTTEQRNNATSRLCALKFLAHRITCDPEREEHYKLTIDGAEAVRAAAGGHVRKSGPKNGRRASGPAGVETLAGRTWQAVRARKAVDAESLAALLCDAGDDFDRVRDNIARYLRRWELAGALARGARRVRDAGAAKQSNGSVRYVLVKDSANPPVWGPVLRQRKAAEAAQGAAR
jgi:hypothetical protein